VKFGLYRAVSGRERREISRVCCDTYNEINILLFQACDGWVFGSSRRGLLKEAAGAESLFKLCFIVRKAISVLFDFQIKFVRLFIPRFVFFGSLCRRNLCCEGIIEEDLRIVRHWMEIVETRSLSRSVDLLHSGRKGCEETHIDYNLWFWTSVSCAKRHGSTFNGDVSAGSSGGGQ
jgi:hypothetical protein